MIEEEEDVRESMVQEKWETGDSNSLGNVNWGREQFDSLKKKDLLEGTNDYTEMGMINISNDSSMDLSLKETS